MADKDKSSADPTPTDDTGNKTAPAADVEVQKDVKETKPATTKVAPVIDDDDDDEVDSDSEDSEGEAEESFIKITQTQFNDAIRKRVDKIKRKSTQVVSKLQAQINQLTQERDNFRAGEVVKVRVEFEALPDAIKEMSPAPLDKLEEDKAFRSIVEWMPKAKKLSEQMGGGNAKSIVATTNTTTVVKGNAPDPTPAGGTKNPSGEKPLHPLWRGF